MANQTSQGITAAEREARRELIQRAIRLNQSEGLQPSSRHLELDEKFIAGNIDFAEYTRTVLNWPAATV